MKQALFHSAIIEDLAAEPLPPPHHELTRYFDPPKVSKRTKEVVDECRDVFAIKKGVIWTIL
jgi:ATP-dependent DNA helicase 2 subunit 2